MDKPKNQGSLTVPIHPDDAKDKVFTAILKALIKMENKPSSPKELANIIGKHKYATLGGATPFATVSSRISQHFKRAAEHNPPRAPLLAKHIDQYHSRKISYSLATESMPTEKEFTDTEDEEEQKRPRERGSKKRKEIPEFFDKQRSDSEHSDFYEDMFKDDNTKNKLAIKRPRKNSVIPKTLAETQKPSFSFNSGFPGEQELWSSFSVDNNDFENAFIHDPSTAHHIPFNIASPESVSVSELDDYFGNTSDVKSQKKSFSSALLGPNDKSLLQKVLLASASSRISADKIEEEKEEQLKKKEINSQEDSVKNEELRSEKISLQKTVQPANKSINSSSLMDVENSEDFVNFEEDENKEPSKANTTQDISFLNNINSLSPSPSSPSSPSSLSSAAAVQSASEMLKSINIQNINLSALQQMTSSFQNLQQLSPTFDLAKTMAVYIQYLSKTSSSSQSTLDFKSILSKFPVLEALLRKDKQTPPPPAETNNLADINNSNPVVRTLSSTTPAMYITIVDHITVCIVVLEKTKISPEFRIMRRLDTGFVNGTALLEAGGIETESERSMILSFEMDRVRMPKKKSPLFGTWIPLRRAQELAITCSTQHRLGHFLEDSIEHYFPSPLPAQMSRKSGKRLTAFALAALKSSDKNKDNFVQKTKEDKKDEEISDSGSSHEDESDSETKNIITGSALQELFSRANLPHPTHIHPKDLQKKKRRSSLPEFSEDVQNEPQLERIQKARKRSGGKWPTSGGCKLASHGIKKSASTGGNVFAKRISVNGKKTVQKKVKEENEEVKNMVVEHTTSNSQIKKSTFSNLNDKEDEEDEDIDIGGSDFDDDLR